MTALPATKYVSPQEYLAYERDALEKHEYVNGEIVSRDGAQIAHLQICTNLGVSIGTQVKLRDCHVLQSDLRLCIQATRFYTYPDISVVCGKPELVPDGHSDNLLNPTLIIEVLSPSTAEYDRGAKFDHYKTIDSLKEYVLVWQAKKRVARHTRREDDSWVLTDFIGDDSDIELVSIGCVLSMADIYEKVENLPPSDVPQILPFGFLCRF